MAAVAWDVEAAEPCTPREPCGQCEPRSPRGPRAGLRPVGSDAVGHARARPGAPAAVYRRRRVGAVTAAVATVAAVLAVAAGSLALPGTPAAPGAQPAVDGSAVDGSAAEPITVVVAPGETLWDIAAPHAPAGTEPMAYVVQIAAFNGVDPRAVQPGTVLQLPPPAN
ncbi:MAG TPA: LysM peptidoglycan-binding domain-containing protein [Egibacteraceae bacterium]|nr:LysM peptidoglycan-binding domain-containing protein [Egibacteraceae bacterium]